MSLRVLLDQNVPSIIVEFLRSRRPLWRILHTSDLGMIGAPDQDAGVVRLRVWPTTVGQTEDALARLLDEVKDADLPGSLVIVDRSQIRVRRSARHG